MSLSCTVDFDTSSIPLFATLDPAARATLKSTAFNLKLSARSPASLSVTYPAKTTVIAKQQVAHVVNVLTSVLTGIFDTWPNKGLSGPVPPFNKSVERVIQTPEGYVFTLQVPGGPVQLSIDKDYLVTEIVSAGGSLKEHPTYTPSSEGLAYSGNDAVQTDPQGQVVVHYEQQNAIIDGLRVPSAARVRVNDSIDLRFHLVNCTVEKAKVLHLSESSPR